MYDSRSPKRTPGQKSREWGRRGGGRDPADPEDGTPGSAANDTGPRRPQGYIQGAHIADMGQRVSVSVHGSLGF